MEIRKLINIIEEIAPPCLAEPWDHCGLQVGTGRAMAGCEVKKVLTSLEITGAVIDEAIERGADFILAHHPMFDRYRAQFLDKRTGELETADFNNRLAKNGIIVYSAHTSFDSAKGGNNDYLAELLGLCEVSGFSDPKKIFHANIGVCGTLREPMSREDFCAHVSKALKLSKGELRVAMPRKPWEKESAVKKVGLCTGAGSDMIELALLNGCDAFVTGDMKYHEAQRLCEKGICVLDAGHYGTEKFFAENMAALLSTRCGGEIDVISSNTNINPFTIF